MRAEDELIFLDARLTAMISQRAFRAELDNGHTFVAWGRASASLEAGIPWQVGDRVRVRLSPYDLSVGEMVTEGEAKP